MTITLRNRLVALFALCALVMAATAALAVQQATTVQQATAVQHATGGTAQRAAVRYWTTARMTAAVRKQAEPRVLLRHLEHRLVHKQQAVFQATAEHRLVHKQQAVFQATARAAPWLSGDSGGRGLRWGHGGTVAAAVGKVFFTLGGVRYVCSGVLVGGAHPDVVLTAAHCVTGGITRHGATRWAADWVFVPGYRDGRLPYGEYTARRFLVTPDWAAAADGSEQDDFAFVQVTAPESHSVPHGLPVAFAGGQDAGPAARAYVFGYPALAPYSGGYATYCAGTAAAAGGSLRTACGMTAGDSGGPWLAGFRPRSGAGTVVAVSTYKLSADPRLLYGTVLSPAARALYLRATAVAAGSR